MKKLFQQQNPPVYYKQPPFRFVQQYPHHFKTHAKKRWLKKPLIQVLHTQFKAYDKNYYLQAIENSSITINGSKVNRDYLIKDNDLIEHKTVRKEPPVLDLPLKKVYEDENFLVLNKPPYITVHSGGGYHFNTILGILYYQMNYKQFYVVHRLDKLTSGILILAKNSQFSNQFHLENSKKQQKKIEKIYLSRVCGQFPHQQITIKKPIICLSNKDGIYAVKTQQHQNLQGKQSETHFKKLWYHKQSNTSLLECKPRTGRTHQIRVHLQYLGYPIVNDTNYGGTFMKNFTVQQNFPDLIKQYKNSIKRNRQEQNQCLGESIRKKRKNEEGEQVDQRKEINSNQKNSEKQWQYLQRPLQICLHSFKYKYKEFIFEAEKPIWTKQDIDI